ncbi:MAG TPA: hypothetical protein VGP07_00350 [Polyangia bacterium]|jgi:hypothetical protein
MPNVNVRNLVRAGTPLALPALLGTAIVSLWIGAPRLLVALSLLAALVLSPAVVLALVLRTIKLKDRHAYLRMARPRFDQALFPAAFGNSSGGRNVS